MKALTGALAAVRLIRPARHQGFCPACKGWVPGAAGSSEKGPHEVNPASLAALVALVVALLAWIVAFEQSRSMGAMGLASLRSFVAAWLVMAAAMMLPSALPLVYEFARNSQGRRGWQIATAAMGITYLSVWLLFGMLFYAVYRAVNIAWPGQPLIGGLAILLAALYAITPLKRASEARCRELCALHGPLPFNLLRSAFVAGARYGFSCMGCTAGLMVAAVFIGMANLGWMAVLTGLVLVYKLAPPLFGKRQLLLSLATGALGIAYIFLA
jgi:predicted metal-binding membrane protein